jgi:hypothetical protein
MTSYNALTLYVSFFVVPVITNLSILDKYSS